MLLIALRKGGAKCSSACPFHQESGVVRGINGPLKTHCRATMETVCVDCDVWNPHEIEKLEVSEQQWQTMQHAIRKRAKKVRKEYPSDHAEIHPVGYNWKNDPKGRWNSTKSSNVPSSSKSRRLDNSSSR
jgi:hypothetical protein